MVIRRKFVRMGVTTAALMAAPWVHAQARPQPLRLTVHLHDSLNMGHLPLVVAQQLGYLEQPGIELNLTDQPLQEPGSPHPGAFDLFAGSFESIYAFHSMGLPYRAFARLCQVPQVVIGVAPHLTLEAHSLRDLSRRKIGVVGEYSSAHRLALLAFRRAGVLPEAQQWQVFSDGVELIQAFRAGKVDAISHAGLDITQLEQQGAIKPVTDTRRVKDTEYVYEGPVPALCLAAPSGLIRSHPQVCQMLADAVQKSLRWLQIAGPVDLVKTVPVELMRGDRAVYLTAFNQMRHGLGPDAVIPETGPFTVFKAMVRLRSDNLPQRIDIASTFTNEFAMRAKGRLGGS